MSDKTLVLNKQGIPVSIIRARRALSLISSNKAIMLAGYDGTLIRSSGSIDMGGITQSVNAVICMPIPSVIQCVHSDYIPKKYTNILPFTRQNVFIRDGGCCQYCGKKVSISSMSFDHVIPRSKGGETSWNNIVIACTRCNSEKGNKLVGKYKEPLRAPYTPKLNRAAPTQLVSRLAMEIPHKSWMDFIYWSIEILP